MKLWTHARELVSAPWVNRPPTFGYLVHRHGHEGGCERGYWTRNVDYGTHTVSVPRLPVRHWPHRAVLSAAFRLGIFLAPPRGRRYTV